MENNPWQFLRYIEIFLRILWKNVSEYVTIEAV